MGQPDVRKALTPVLGAVLLILIVISLAGGAYTFLTGYQEEIFDDFDGSELATVNISCMPQHVEWWINNTGEERLEVDQANLFIYDADGVNTSLSATDVAVDAGFQNAGGGGGLTVEPGAKLGLGRSYQLELSLGDIELSGQCTVGSEWWDVEWGYRKVLKVEESGFEGGPATIELDTASLVEEGKMRSDCGDLRVVKQGEIVPEVQYPADCESDEATLKANLGEVSSGEVYLYYGNLNADPRADHPFGGYPTDVELGPEEAVDLN